MVKPGTLLLLLAVAASQAGLLSAALVYTTDVDLSSCPITFYGESFSYMEVLIHQNATVEFCFKEDPADDGVNCLVLEDGGPSDSLMASVSISQTALGSDLHTILPEIQSASECYLYMTLMADGSPVIDFYFYDFGDQAAVEIITFSNYTAANVNITTLYGDTVLDAWDIDEDDASDSEYLDISGCRHSGDILLPGDVSDVPDDCSTITCNASAYLHEVENCGHLEICVGDDNCVPQTIVCTVIGPNIIDFFDETYTILDRCVYLLMKGDLSASYFNISAGFRERRRKDVSFLDYLIIYHSMSSTTVYLGQGGTVEVDGVAWQLSTTPQVVDSLSLTKDVNDVNCVEILEIGMKVCFDGNVACLTGQTGVVLEGLCGNANSSFETTTVSAEYSQYLSDYGCWVEHDDDDDDTIDCLGSSARCNLTGEDLFSACHEYVDPAPYMAVCSSTACQYPDVDGLVCHFLEAYAKACSLKRNVTLEDWRSEAGCSVIPQDACRDQYCSDDEFCGENLGEIRCLCRALFAATFDNSTNPFGESTVCTQNSASLTLAACRLWGSGIDYSNLHLNDEDCVGVIDDLTHMVTFSFGSDNDCGADITTTGSQIFFNNTIVTRNYSEDSIINRHDDVEIDFSCYYTQPDEVTLSFRIKNSSVVQHIVSDIWNYTVLMNAYIDANHLQLIEPGAEIQLGQRVFMELTAEELDPEMVTMVIDSCWATNQPSPADASRYDLIVEGCPNFDDETVELQENGLGVTDYFSFSMFEFFGGDTEIYLHCQPELCPVQGPSCAPDCVEGRRRRRSSNLKYLDGNSALITMVWNK